MAITIFLFFVAVVLGISFFLGAKAKSAQGFFAAGGGVPWWVNGIAFAGDYLSAASFLGICGMIAFYGYDGFLYSIGSPASPSPMPSTTSSTRAASSSPPRSAPWWCRSSTSSRRWSAPAR